MSVRSRVLVAALLLLPVLAACSTDESGHGPGTDRPSGSATGTAGCGPVAFDEVAGRPPSYVDGPMNGFPNDHAVCAGAWLPRTGTKFVPQGLVVEGGTAWVSGYDGGGAVGSLYCRVLKVDLATGRKLDERAPVGGQIGFRDPVDCRHGGGLSRDEHGLWLAEKRRLWLLDPQTLETLRAWAIVLPVWGSFVVHDDAGRIGLAGFAEHRPTRMHWFDPDDLLAPGAIEVTTGLAVGEQSVPARGQGAFHADLGRGPAKVWFVRSTTRCGMLDGGPRSHLGFIPGAEGAAVSGRSLWVVSESTSAPYFLDGGRPVVPALARFDLRAIEDWEPAPCTP